MEQPLFVKHLPKMLKIFTFLDTNTNELHVSLFLFIFVTKALFLSSTALCVCENIGEFSITKLHDLLFFTVVFTNDIFFLINKSGVATIVRSLNEKFIVDSTNLKIVEEYKKEVSYLCTVVAAIYITGALSWYSASLVVYLVSDHPPSGCTRVVVGWAYNSDYTTLLVVLNIANVLVSIPSFLLWYLVMLCMVVRIKYQTRLLCASLCVPSLHSIGEPPRVTVPPTTPGERRMWLANERILRSMREKRVKRQVSSYFSRVVRQHIRIIELAKLTDITFRHSVFNYIQLGMLVLALTIPKIHLNNLKPEYVNRAFEVFMIMGITIYFNYLGQIVLVESENLRQALYDSSWSDAHTELRKGLIIMQILATRPLKLTIGGVYTLSLNTQTQILETTYSFISLVQSLNNE